MLKAALLGILLVVPAAEAGSWFITRVQLEDHAHSAAVEAAYDVQGLPVTSATARTALDVAEQALQGSGGDGIDPATFRLLTDGTVTFTSHRAAPSLVLGRWSVTRDLMTVHATVAATPSA